MHLRRYAEVGTEHQNVEERVIEVILNVAS